MTQLPGVDLNFSSNSAKRPGAPSRQILVGGGPRETDLRQSPFTVSIAVPAFPCYVVLELIQDNSLALLVPAPTVTATK